MPDVITVPLGVPIGQKVLPFVNAYLVRDRSGWVIVDTGPPGCAPVILAAMPNHGIREDEVQLILLTHGHYDHSGSALELRRRLPTHPRIAMHPADRPLVSGQLIPKSLRPRSLLGGLAVVGGLIGTTAWRFSGALRPWSTSDLDEVIWLDSVSDADAGTPLAPICGLDATAIRTPGHSPGSISILMPGGEALIGDSLGRGLRRTDPHLPHLVDQPDLVLPSLQRIAALRPTLAYCGHGGPFTGEDLQRLLERKATSDRPRRPSR